MKPCCTWQFDKDYQSTHQIGRVDLITWHKHPDIQRAKDLLKQGIWPKNCSFCEEQEKQENIQKVMDVINGLFAYTVILPLLFMFAFNISLTKMFGFDKIDYVESLGVVIVARVLRGKK